MSRFTLGFVSPICFGPETADVSRSYAPIPLSFPIMVFNAFVADLAERTPLGQSEGVTTNLGRPSFLFTEAVYSEWTQNQKR